MSYVYRTQSCFFCGTWTKNSLNYTDQNGTKLIVPIFEWQRRHHEHPISGSESVPKGSEHPNIEPFLSNREFCIPSIAITYWMSEEVWDCLTGDGEIQNQKPLGDILVTSSMENRKEKYIDKIRNSVFSDSSHDRSEYWTQYTRVSLRNIYVCNIMQGLRPNLAFYFKFLRTKNTWHCGKRDDLKYLKLVWAGIRIIIVEFKASTVLNVLRDNDFLKLILFLVQLGLTAEKKKPLLPVLEIIDLPNKILPSLFQRELELGSN